MTSPESRLKEIHRFIKVYQADGVPIDENFLFLLEQLDLANKRNEILREGCQFYAEWKNWYYTTYDNYHEMHDDERLVKAPNGSFIEVSGSHAIEALKAADEVK